MIVFETRLTVPKGRLTAEAAGAFGDALTRDTGFVAAEMVRSKYQELLSPGGSFRIGASGAASRNFEINSSALPGSGRFVWQVIEGGMTPANELIRRGIPAGRSVTIARLKIWAAQKGIILVHPDDVGKTAEENPRMAKVRVIKGYPRRSGGVRPHGRTVWGGKEVANAALSAIRTVLFRSGTERKEANWWERYPQGQGRFDYPAFLSRNVGFRLKIQSAINDQAENIILTFFSSGKRLGVRSELVKII